MDQRAKDLKKRGDNLFEKRSSLLSFWQELADNFYPERADFTVSRSLGSDITESLTSSYPVLVRRDLANSFSSMLRRRDGEWFAIRAAREDREDRLGREWMEWATGVQRRAMYDRIAMFTRATKEADHDFGTFGQCVLTPEFNPRQNALLFRSWHLRDCAWAENAEGEVSEVHRKWKPTATVLKSLFPSTVHQTVNNLLDKEPFKEINCRHIVIPAESYKDFKTNQPRVSVYIDCDNDNVLEEQGIPGRHYIIPRWQTVSGSQYAYSPATVTALPDARLIQAMTLSLIEAGEKAANPPLVATRDVVKSNIEYFAGGVTWVDSEYDERLGDALRPLNQDTSGIPLGIEMSRETRALIDEAFYLDKLTLPSSGPDMTAFEVGQRVQEFIRQALPIFEPLEMEYNAALCEETFDILMRNGAFGSSDDIPASLQGEDIQFKFESPLQEATERAKGQKFIEGKAMLAQAAELEPNTAKMLDAKTALRDVLKAIGVPAKWTRDERQMAAIEEVDAQQQQASALLESMQRGAEVTQSLGEANEALIRGGAAA